MTWDQIYDNAIDTGCGDERLRIKDIARYEVECLVMDLLGYNINDAEIPEEEVDHYTSLWDIQFNKEGRIKRYKMPVGA